MVAGRDCVSVELNNLQRTNTKLAPAVEGAEVLHRKLWSQELNVEVGWSRRSLAVPNIARPCYLSCSSRCSLFAEQRQ